MLVKLPVKLGELGHHAQMRVLVFDDGELIYRLDNTHDHRADRQ